MEREEIIQLIYAVLNEHLIDPARLASLFSAPTVTGNRGVIGTEKMGLVELTAPLNITATTEASANTVVTAPAITFDGSTEVLFEFFAPNFRPPAAVNGILEAFLFDGSTSMGIMAQSIAETAIVAGTPCYAVRQMIPTAGSHTYSIRARVSSLTGIVSAGLGGTGNYMPCFLKIARYGSVLPANTALINLLTTLTNLGIIDNKTVA